MHICLYIFIAISVSHEASRTRGARRAGPRRGAARRPWTRSRREREDQRESRVQDDNLSLPLSLSTCIIID